MDIANGHLEKIASMAQSNGHKMQQHHLLMKELVGQQQNPEESKELQGEESGGQEETEGVSGDGLGGALENAPGNEPGNGAGVEDGTGRKPRRGTKVRARRRPFRLPDPSLLSDS
ncbi:hypothetical protein ID866_9522 [Astraeus odoratus]|nr:hypothetical protein ID866_9522 [Astraeus odoratus]